MTGGAGGYPVEGAYPGEYGRPPYGVSEDMYAPRPLSFPLYGAKLLDDVTVCL